MENQEFKAGDLVRFKSGSPIMTVVDRYEDGLLKCLLWSEERARFTGLDNINPVVLVAA